jgi:hypothetical protein
MEGSLNSFESDCVLFLVVQVAFRQPRTNTVPCEIEANARSEMVVSVCMR